MTRSIRLAAWRAAMAERILVVDGAMGTSIQGYPLDEADFRGDRYSANTTRPLNTSLRLPKRSKAWESDLFDESSR